MNADLAVSFQEAAGCEHIWYARKSALHVPQTHCVRLRGTRAMSWGGLQRRRRTLSRLYGFGGAMYHLAVHSDCAAATRLCALCRWFAGSSYLSVACLAGFARRQQIKQVQREYKSAGQADWGAGEGGERMMEFAAWAFFWVMTCSMRPAVLGHTAVAGALPHPMPIVRTVYSRSGFSG